SNLPVTDAFAHLPWPVTLVRNLDAELAGIRMAQDYPAQESILLLHWGHGIGASLYTDGAVINRERGRFCEIGHWGLGNSKGRPCTCGNRDCLETVAALWALGPQLRAAFPDLPLDESSLAPELGRIDLMSVGAMQEALSQMLRLTANLCRLFFPDRVILTGPFVQNPLIFRQFVDAISSAPLVRSLDIVRVSVNEIGQRDEILGALSQPFAALLEGFLGGGSQ
ncbi:ROK family protein, partial [Paracoccus sp. (in: a-proteobacteria)]|uniref:ROK family protein n=1 Tax=Paracoccus sp. TaxID=267 RepID=UPI003A89EBBE